MRAQSICFLCLSIRISIEGTYKPSMDCRNFVCNLLQSKGLKDLDCELVSTNLEDKTILVDPNNAHVTIVKK